MRVPMIMVLVASAACGGKKASHGPTPLGTTGLAIQLPEGATVKEDKPGYWDVERAGQGHTSITVPYVRGMPSPSMLESSVREDGLVGDAGNVEDGPGGMKIHTIHRTKDGNQWFEYAYIPMPTGTALCEGWSQTSATDPSLGLCRKITVAQK